MVSFKDYCIKYKYKVPLSKEYFDYYTSLGYRCFVVLNLYGYYQLVPRSSWYDGLSVLTITELKFIIENCSNKKIFPFSKIDKYINELRTNKTKTVI